MSFFPEEVPMRWIALVLLTASGALVAAEDKPEGKQHEYRADALRNVFSAPPNAPAGWKPVVRVKANDSISVIYPFALKDLDLFECSSDNADVRLSVAEDDKGVRVGIRSGDRTGGGKKGAARVSWRVVEVNGREHRWSTDVIFE